jgi:hypothetical protein
VPKVYKEDKWGNQVSSERESDEKRQRQLVNEAVGREPPFREDLSPAVVEYPLLEAVTRQLLAKTLRAGRFSVIL